MHTILWFTTGIGGLVGALLWCIALLADAAPAQGAAAALAAAIPYVLARAWDEIAKPEVSTMKIEQEQVAKRRSPQPAPAQREPDVYEIP